MNEMAVELKLTVCIQLCDKWMNYLCKIIIGRLWSYVNGKRLNFSTNKDVNLHASYFLLALSNFKLSPQVINILALYMRINR